ncbi:hypothetical protein [Ethanoligenens harbinense]|uniref:hypothetical protein n=1 Tax=Ethanoligenens harbinense TaxID=253239 RepID=UPI001FA6AE80|nr:hypothetical protein [Ethanoligenens harbinense]
MKKELVLHTLNAAQRRWNLPTDRIFHSDRGSQYTSQAVKDQIHRMAGNQAIHDLEPRETMPGVKVFSPFSKKKLSIGISTLQEKLPIKPYLKISGFFTTAPCSKAAGVSFPNSFPVEMDSAKSSA